MTPGLVRDKKSCLACSAADIGRLDDGVGLYTSDGVVAVDWGLVATVTVELLVMAAVGTRRVIGTGL